MKEPGWSERWIASEEAICGEYESKRLRQVVVMRDLCCSLKMMMELRGLFASLERERGIEIGIGIGMLNSLLL